MAKRGSMDSTEVGDVKREEQQGTIGREEVSRSRGGGRNTYYEACQYVCVSRFKRK